MQSQKFVALVGRIFLAVIFLHAGINKLFFGFAQTQQQMADAGIPISFVVLIFTILFQIAGSISLILGYKTKIGSILLLIFLIPATVVFHNPIADPTQMTQFLKNLSIMGGLLLILSFGAGEFSLDERIASAR
jgi:putative oxidoreductase